MLKRIFRATSVTAIVFMALSIFSPVQAAEKRPSPERLSALAQGSIAPAPEKTIASTFGVASVNLNDSSSVGIASVAQNANFQMVNAAGEGIAGLIYAVSTTGDFFRDGPTDSSGRISFDLPNDSYEFGFIPTTTETNTTAYLAGNVTNGVLTVEGTINGLTGASAVKVGDVWKVTLPDTNFRVKLVHPVTGSSLIDCHVTVFQAGSSWEPTTFVAGAGVSLNGRVGFSLSNGDYVGQIYTHGTSAGLIASDFRISIADANVTVSQSSSNISIQDGAYPVSPGLPNISGSFVSGGSPVVFGTDQGIGIGVQKKNLSGNWQWVSKNSYSTANIWAMKLTDTGQYRIVATPNNFGEYVQSYSPNIWVNSQGWLSLTQDGTYVETLTAVTIEMKTPNLKLTVVNPLNGDEPVAGGYAQLYKVSGGVQNFESYMSVSTVNPGRLGFNIVETGTYVLEIYPPEGSLAISGLAAKKYQIDAASLESITVRTGSNPVPILNDRFIVRLAEANVTARIYRPDGTIANSSGTRSYYVMLQKLNQWNNWDGISNGVQVDQNGYVSFKVDTAGTYRLRIEPNNDSTASLTYSNEFTVAAGQEANFEKKFGNITLNPPAVRVSVAAPGAPDVLLKFVNILIKKDGQWYDWSNTRDSGVAGIGLNTAGNYAFEVQPTESLQGSTTKKSYKFTATLNNDGTVTALPESADGVSISNGIVKLLLGLPTLQGTVKDPTGTIPQAYSRVMARDVQTGKDLWEYSAETNQNGLWSMQLPAGTYQIFADAPWGNSIFGKSNTTGSVVVNSSSVATSVPSGYTANEFNLRLKNPTWSGTVKDPTGTSVVPYARICLLEEKTWNCAGADKDGRWGLSVSDSFTSFAGQSPILEIYDDNTRLYPSRRIESATVISNLLGPAGSTNREIRFLSANVQISVLAPESAFPASNLWVAIERENVGYVAGGTTDQNGLVKLYISDLSQEFKVRVDLNGNPNISQNFAGVLQRISLDSITAGTDNNGLFSASITLPTPNFKFIVREPTDAGNAIPYSWVEVHIGNDGQWLGGTNTNRDGIANFKLDAPMSGTSKSYTVTVNPAWDATTNFTRQAYAVTVDSSGSVVSVINKTNHDTSTVQIVAGKSLYPLKLGVPSVTGTVVDPSDNTVANSWIVPMNGATNEYYWMQGVNSRQNGQLAMNLADGSYKLEANIPWDATGLTKSARCAVTVAAGKISTGGDCVQGTDSKTVKLQLRLPNVKFTLKVNGTPITNAYVSVGAGSWWTNARSDSNGVVSLFIDADAVRDANRGTTGAIRLYFWVDPPYGSSIMARWSCGSTENKPICKDLPDVPASGDYVGDTSAWTVEGVQPNLRLKVVAPGTATPLPNSWVVVYAKDFYGNKWWLNGANSGSDGFAAINVETATAFTYGYNKLVVEVNAPWDQRSRYATSEYNSNGLGYTFESLTALSDLSPALPNLHLRIKDSNTYDNRYGWYGIQEVQLVNGVNNYVRWVGGYGLNDSGEGSVYLPANKRYKVTLYPGGGRQGVESSCIFTTDGSNPVVVTLVECDGTSTLTNSTLDLRLAGGNVSGTVMGLNNIPLAGAIVYANQPGAATEASAVITVTDAAGHYDLQLKTGLEWTIRVFPPSELSSTLGMRTVDAPFTPSNGTNIIKNFNFATT